MLGSNERSKIYLVTHQLKGLAGQLDGWKAARLKSLVEQLDRMCRLPVWVVWIHRVCPTLA